MADPLIRLGFDLGISAYFLYIFLKEYKANRFGWAAFSGVMLVLVLSGLVKQL